MINGACRWHHEGNHRSFPGNDFWCTTPYSKCQPLLELWSWSLDAIGQYLVCRQKLFLGHVTKFIKSLTNFFLSKGIPNFSTSCYIKKFANNMQLQATTTWACQNISKLKRNVCNGTVIRVLLKCSEPLWRLNNTQTKFLRSRMYTTPSHFTVNTCYQLEDPLQVSLADIRRKQSFTRTRYIFHRLNLANM